MIGKNLSGNVTEEACVIILISEKNRFQCRGHLKGNRGEFYSLCMDQPLKKIR